MRAVRKLKGQITSLLSNEDCIASPWPELLRTNEAPSDIQIESLRRAIAATEEEICQDAMDKSAMKRLQACEEFVAAHRKILSPMRRLPSELLAEVFSWFLPADPSNFVATISGPIYATSWIHLRLVSRQWKEGIDALRDLYSYLPRVELTRKTATHIQYVQGLKLYLAQSGNSPLRVTITAPSPEITSHPALDALVNHAPRWELLAMDVSCFAILDVLSNRDVHLDCLRYLKLDFRAIYTINLARMDPFRSAIRIEKLVLRGKSTQPIDLPLTSLKCYIEGLEQHSHLGKVLRMSSLTLERLEVHQTVPVPLDQPVNLPLLKVLKIRQDSVDPPSDIIDKLILPSLETLQIIGHPNRDVLGSLRSLVTRSVCGHHLRYLAIRVNQIWTGHGKMASLLRAVPCLEELDIDLPPSVDPTEVSWCLHRGELVPVLQRLRIHIEGARNELECRLYQLIGQYRCNRSLPSDNPPRLLKEYRLTFFSREHCRPQQALLEGWTKAASEGSHEAQRLIDLKSKLLLELPEIDENTWWSNSVLRKRAVDFGFAKRMHKLLGEIEDMVIHDPLSLHISQLHFTMKRLAELSEGRIPGDGKFQFRERAQGLLNKWGQSVFATAIPNMHWVQCGFYSLIFLPDHSDVRRRPDAVDQMIYGMDDPVDVYDLLWWTHMS